MAVTDKPTNAPTTTVKSTDKSVDKQKKMKKQKNSRKRILQCYDLFDTNVYIKMFRVYM